MAILNLDQRFPIVDPKTGQPTDYFMRMLRGVTGPVGDAATDIATLFDRNLTAGNGLTGGGDLTADRSFAVGAGTGITVNADDVAIDTTAEAERIRDVIGAALVAGSNVTVTVNDGADTITIAATGGGSGSAYEASPTTVPDLSGFTAWRNQGASATATADSSGVVLGTGGNNDGQLHIREMALPATPFSYYTRVQPFMAASAAGSTSVYVDCGFSLANNTNGRVLKIGLATAGSANLYSIDRWTTATTFSAQAVARYNAVPSNWLRIDVTATGVTMFGSPDGRRWVQIGAIETFATFLTASGGVADRLGIYVRGTGIGASNPAYAYFDLLQATAP